MQIFAHIGLAMATSLAAYSVLLIQAWVLVKAKKLDMRSLRIVGAPALASFIMGTVIFTLLWADIVPANWSASQIIELTLLIVAGTLTYVIVSWQFGCLPKELLKQSAKTP